MALASLVRSEDLTGQVGRCPLWVRRLLVVAAFAAGVWTALALQEQQGARADQRPASAATVDLPPVVSARAPTSAALPVVTPSETAVHPADEPPSRSPGAAGSPALTSHPVETAVPVPPDHVSRGVDAPTGGQSGGAPAGSDAAPITSHGDLTAPAPGAVTTVGTPLSSRPYQRHADQDTSGPSQRWAGAPLGAGMRHTSLAARDAASFDARPHHQPAAVGSATPIGPLDPPSLPHPADPEPAAAPAASSTTSAGSEPHTSELGQDSGVLSNVPEAASTHARPAGMPCAGSHVAGSGNRPDSRPD